MLRERLGIEDWVKHENHTPNGTFQIREGLVYFAHLANASAIPTGVACASHGNHGQSVGFVARRYGISETIVVPHANVVEKNVAMRSLGVKLLEHGYDFSTAREFAKKGWRTIFANGGFF